VSCQGTRQKFSMPSVRSGHSTKSDFAECPDLALGELSLCRVPDRGTRQSLRHLVAAPAHALTHTQQTHGRRTPPPPPEEEDLGPAPAPRPAPGAPRPRSAAAAKPEEEELGPVPVPGANRPRAPPVTCSARSRNRESTPHRPRLHRRPSVSNATAPVIDNVHRSCNRHQLGVSRLEEIQLRYADLCISIIVSISDCPRYLDSPRMR